MTSVTTLILDNVANHSLSEFRRVLKPNGIYVLIGGGGASENRWLGPVTHPSVQSDVFIQIRQPDRWA